MEPDVPLLMGFKSLVNLNPNLNTNEIDSTFFEIEELFRQEYNFSSSWLNALISHKDI